MLKLFYYPGNASLAPHLILEEIGAPYELTLIDRTKAAHKSAEYLRLNPTGRIPTLIDGDLVVFETAAIALHILDKYPRSGLAPAVGTPERAIFYQWIIHLTNTLQTEFRPYFYPHEHTDEASAVAGVKAKAEARLDTMFDLIERHLEAGPYLLGATVSAADLYLLMLIRWSRGMRRPARELRNLKRLADLLLARPAVRRCLDQEGIGAPFI
ncbi:MAG TPA: glutathione S-transferase family protein [Stellaceae bacterium]|nr:glutathione S-transferase family protein [Stellaceae bacterium]